MLHPWVLLRQPYAPLDERIHMFISKLKNEFSSELTVDLGQIAYEARQQGISFLDIEQTPDYAKLEKKLARPRKLLQMFYEKWKLIVHKREKFL